MENVRELLVDAYGCTANLSDNNMLERLARDAAQSVGATVADSVSHQFQPHGLTLCLILKESHLVISTWPEHELAIVNIFLCNPSMSAHDCWHFLERGLQPTHCVFHTVEHRIGRHAKVA